MLSTYTMAAREHVLLRVNNSQAYILREYVYIGTVDFKGLGGKYRRACTEMVKVLGNILSYHCWLRTPGALGGAQSKH